MEQGRPYLVG